jgi:hypothetical protein
MAAERAVAEQRVVSLPEFGTPPDNIHTEV